MQFPHLPFMGSPVSPNTMVILSDSGRTAVYSLNETGTNFVIVKELEAAGGMMAAGRIAAKVHCDMAEMRIRLKDLKKAGYIRFGGEGEQIMAG